MQRLSSFLQQAEGAIKDADDLLALQQVKTNLLGKKGSLTAYLNSLSNMDAVQRPGIGRQLNQAKQQIQCWLQQRTEALQQIELEQKLTAAQIDFTLPGRGQQAGSLHPLTQVRERIEKIFHSMGFSVAEGPEIEDDYHNFTALNLPKHHPARANFDTFYFGDGRLLRTHTSPVQVRVMATTPPPLRIIAPGRVYRCDSDATHTPMFHQLEGLLIDETINFAHLKGILYAFLQCFFEHPIEIRLRPSYFPFTEPSAEIDVSWQTGKWLEVLGCGMVHPQVLAMAGIDSEKYSGCAFGMGIDRLTMLYYGIDDLRLFFENDLRFLAQF